MKDLTKDSDNSSTPPSKESMKDEVVRRTKSLRKKSGRKPGGQNGHEGQTLMKTATPDVTEDIAPVYCKNCGASLKDCERILDYITQEVSLPDLNPIVKEFRHYITICKNVGSPFNHMLPASGGLTPLFMMPPSKAWSSICLWYYSFLTAALPISSKRSMDLE